MHSEARRAEAPERQPGFSVGGVRIRGVVSALPERRIANDVFVGTFGQSALNDVVKMIGVESRYWVAPGQTTSDLCFAAAERLLDELAWERDSVDALLFVSQTPDQRLPATACVLQARLGLGTRCQAFDVALGCSGYVYGLWLASALISAGCSRVLVLAGDTLSPMLDRTDRGTAVLFGDAGSATALERDPDAPLSHFVLGSDGAGARNLAVTAGGYRSPEPDPRRPESLSPDHLFMDGGEVFTFTLKSVPLLVRQALEQAGAAVESVDAVLFHQANQFMLRHLAKKLALTPEQSPTNIDRYGNTSSASIPLLLTTDMAERVRSGPTRLALVGFGVGYSWAAAVMDLQPLACAETITA